MRNLVIAIFIVCVLTGCSENTQKVTNVPRIQRSELKVKEQPTDVKVTAEDKELGESAKEYENTEDKSKGKEIRYNDKYDFDENTDNISGSLVTELGYKSIVFMGVVNILKQYCEMNNLQIGDFDVINTGIDKSYYVVELSNKQKRIVIKTSETEDGYSAYLEEDRDEDN